MSSYTFSKMLTLVLVLLCLLGSVSCVSNSKVVSDESRYPYAAVVATSEGAMLCGAALIDKEKKWFVSAGRCFTEISNNGLLSDTIVAAGSTVLSKMHGFAISKIVVHPYFSRFNYANDIALFRSDKFNLDLEPVALPDHSVEVGDFKRYATLGWGDTGVGKVSQTLAEGNVTGLTDSATFCKLMTGKEDVHRTLCGLGSKAGICAYDYGTPLIGAAEDPADDANDTLVGIGSWFNKCGGKAPALYTDVRPYVDWILHVIENDGKVNFCSSPCSNMKSLVDENGSPCVLSTGESKCTMTACQIRCPLGSLDNGKCNNECNYPTCSFDNNTCQHTTSKSIVDPSFESVKDNWEYYYQYAKPFSTKDSCSELGIANFNCSPAEGSSMMLAYGFPTSVASKNGIYVYSYVAQRVAFPTGPSYLSFYLQASCSAMEQSEYFDIKIDDALFVEVTASECAKYESQRGNWTWMALPLGEHADGKEHTLLFEFYLGSATPYTVFAMDVLRFVTTSFTPDAQAGPCLDGSHPVALPQDGNAYNSSVSSRVCGWQAISCCRGTGLEEKVRTVIAEREGSPCDIASTCLKLLSTLTCIDCAPVNYSIINAETGKPRVCKDYAKHLYASCKGSRMEINGKSCARISALFENPKEFVNYFAEYTSSNRDDCFSMDYMPLLTPDEQEFMRDALKGKSLSGGAIAGIVVLCVVVVALVVIVVLAWIFVYRPRHPRMKGNDTDRMYGGGGSSSSSGKKNKNSSSSKKKRDKKKDGSKKGKGDVELETMKTRKKKDGGGGAADNADGMKKKKKSDLDRVPKTMKSSKKPSGTGDEEEEEEEAGRAVGKKNVKGGKEDKKAASAKAKKKKSAASDNYEEEISY